ncbi:MAG: hypothetical protein ACLRZZ_04140 [Enterocloster sp.]
MLTITLELYCHQFAGRCGQDLPHGPGGRHAPVAPSWTSSVTLYRFLKPTRLHAGFIIAVLMVSCRLVHTEKTTVGYEIKVVWILTSARPPAMESRLSGNIAHFRVLKRRSWRGIAGAVEVMGAQRKLLGGNLRGVRIHSGARRPYSSDHPLGVLFAAIAPLQPWRCGANSTPERQMGSAVSHCQYPGRPDCSPLILGRELFYRKRKSS